MRWVWMAIAILGFVVAYQAATPGLLGLGVLVGFVASTICVFSFASQRIQEIARPDAQMMTPAEMAAMRKRAEAQRAAGGAARKLPPARPAPTAVRPAVPASSRPTLPAGRVPPPKR